MHADLFPYQQDGARFLAARAFALLADDMGVGKTPQAIAGCDLVAARSVLVVCPAIARTNWVREFERWQTVRRTVASLTRLTDPPVTDVVVVSYAGASNLRLLRKLCKRSWDVLIADEAHMIKNPVAERTKAIYGGRCEKLTGLSRLAQHTWLLTGTPAPNNPSELWPHLFAAGATKLKLPAFTAHYCNTYDDGFKMKITGAKKARLPELVGLLQPITLRRKLEAVQKDLPPIRYAHVVLSPDTVPKGPDMPPEARAVLDDIRARLKLGTFEPTAAAAMHLATLRRWTGMAKTSALAEIILDEIAAGKTKMVVFAIHRDVLRMLELKIGEHRVVRVDGDTPPLKRQAAIDAFQTKTMPQVFLCQLSVGATALTLTASCDVLFAEASWTPMELAQAAKRCHRIGQTKPVLARCFSLSGSVDEEITEAVTKKLKDISALHGQLTTTPRI